LSKSPPRQFVDLLRERGVTPLSVGRVVVATSEPNDGVVLRAIRDLGLELQVIFNKGAVMVLPSGVNKATGLREALKELGLSPHNTVGIGDAENDHAFFDLCEASAAVANALPALKERADEVTQQRHGAGVSEVIERLVAGDLQELEPRLSRHNIPIGRNADQGDPCVKAYGATVLVMGDSHECREQFFTSFVGRLFNQCYQTCIVDPIGDYSPPQGAVVFGGDTGLLSVERLLHALDQPQENILVRLRGTSPAERPAFLQQLLAAVSSLRTRCGRPHWTVLADAQQLLPAGGPMAAVKLSDAGSIMLLAKDPREIAPAFLQSVNFAVATGGEAAEALSQFCAATARKPPRLPIKASAGARDALAWNCEDSNAVWMRPLSSGNTRVEELQEPVAPSDLSNSLTMAGSDTTLRQIETSLQYLREVPVNI
jgi:hypothetical protein